MKFICIGGKKRSGKDTVAGIICSNKTVIKYELARPIKQILCLAYTDLELEKSSGQKLTIHDWYGAGYDREACLMLSNKDVVSLIKESINMCSIRLSVPLKSKNNHSSFFEKTAEPFFENEILSNSKPWSIRRLMQLFGTDIIVNEYDKNYWLKLMMTEYFSNTESDKYKYFLITDVRQEHEKSFMKNVGASMLYISRDNIDLTDDTHITEESNIHTDEFLIKNNGSIEELNTKVIEFLETL